MRVFFLIVWLLQSLALGGEFQVQKYLEQDALMGEMGKKESFKKGKRERFHKREKNLYKYPSFDDFWKFSSEYWLVKNMRNLKWDRGRRDRLLEKKFSELIKGRGFSSLKFKVFIFPTNWIPHFVLLRGRGELFFFISQRFIDIAKLNRSDLSFLLFEDLLKVQRGELLNFLKKSDFYKKIGSEFFEKRRPDIGEFEKMIWKITSFYRDYGSTFEGQFYMVKEARKLLGDQLKNYQLYLQKIETSWPEQLKVFEKLQSLYPAELMKKKWAN